jgi:hypothetical protein
VDARDRVESRSAAAEPGVPDQAFGSIVALPDPIDAIGVDGDRPRAEFFGQFDEGLVDGFGAEVRAADQVPEAAVVIGPVDEAVVDRDRADLGGGSGGDECGFLV